ncbi:MAG: amidohydrolase [Bryobacterales bacterium]|nr:amidohydrolase [Bryobacterales bacterium]
MTSLTKYLLVTMLVVPVFGAEDPKTQGMKADLIGKVDSMKTKTQIMVDSMFSFGELGFQEFETSKYLTGILEKEGFKIERNYAGIPTAWTATWGSGKPVIAIGSDIDCIPQASQKPGVAWHEAMIDGAPGHGEGHNSGQAVNITAVLAVKELMERQHMKGTLKLWAGVAEEDLGTKAYFVRAGMLKDVDICIFTHVGANLAVSSGPGGSNGLISVEYQFKGESAHAAGAPWRGRSALDAVELMDVGWNFRREHLRLTQRSHYVITNGGDQPNVVPPNATVWYYFREADYDHIKELWDMGDKMAQGATLMTNTTFTSRVLGEAWPGYFSKPIADVTWENIKKVGLPTWSDDDQKLAKALQHEIKTREIGLATKLREPRKTEPAQEGDPDREPMPMGGGSDDIGDISWNVPTIVLNYPSNIPGLPGHNWSNAIAMATPIAHKGATAGAKVEALTILDILTKPELVQSAWDYFKTVQTKSVQYKPLIRPEDKPAIWLNEKIMAEYRPKMKQYYYDPTKYKTYLEQLGIKYPTVR